MTRPVFEPNVEARREDTYRLLAAQRAAARMPEPPGLCGSYECEDGPDCPGPEE